MELKILAPSADGFIKNIEWNHEEIKQEITEKVNIYNTLVYDDNQIKEAKADRAELNKFKKTIEDKRKEIKAQCLAPYEAFEKQVKEITAIIDEPIGVIDTQIKAYEEKQKAEKETQVKELFEARDFHGFTFDEIANPKWLNVTTSMKSIEEELDKIASDIAADIQIIEDLPEYSFEAMQVYKISRDVRAALGESKRLSELAKQKAEYEAQKAAEEAAKAEEAQRAAEQPQEDTFTPLVEEVQPEEVTPTENEPSYTEEGGFCPNFDEIPNERTWAAYKVYVTPDDREALKAFLDSRSIEYTTL